MRILTAGMLVADDCIRLKPEEEELLRAEKDGGIEKAKLPLLLQVIIDNGLAGMFIDEPGPTKKIIISQAQHDQQFSEAVSGRHTTMFAGGSIALTLGTMEMLSPDKVSIRYLATLDNTQYGSTVKRSFTGKDIQVFPETLPVRSDPRTPVSYLIFSSDGKRCAMATYGGTTKRDIKPNMVTGALVDRADVVFMNAQIWVSLQETVKEGDSEKLGVADTMRSMAWDRGKDVWLSIPNTAWLGEEYVDLKQMEYHLSDARRILTNEGQLMRLTGTNTREDALARLHEIFRNNQNEQVQGRQEAFITLGRDGAVVVTNEGISEIIPAKNIDGGVTELGQGDAAQGGYLAARTRMEPFEAAQYAMEVAALKRDCEGPQLMDVRPLLSKLPDLDKVRQAGTRV